MGLKISEEKRRLEYSPVLSGTGMRRNYPVKGIEVCGSAILPGKGILNWVWARIAASKGRLGAKLLQNQLFDGVIEETPSSADAGLA